jgi:hypothetical protein
VGNLCQSRYLYQATYFFYQQVKPQRKYCVFSCSPARIAPATDGAFYPFRHGFGFLMDYGGGAEAECFYSCCESAVVHGPYEY